VRRGQWFSDRELAALRPFINRDWLAVAIEDKLGEQGALKLLEKLGLLGQDSNGGEASDGPP
jgi:hypothetical protein